MSQSLIKLQSKLLTIDGVENLMFIDHAMWDSGLITWWHLYINLI